MLFPLPTRPGLSNNFVLSNPTANDRDIINLRGDHTLGPQDTFFGRWSRQKVGENSPSSIPVVINASRYDVDNIGGGWNHIFSPTTVLEAKFGYNKPWLIGGSQNPGLLRGDFIDKTGIKMFQRDVLYDPIPGLNAVGEFSLGPGGQITGDHVYQAIVNFSKVMGKHSFKAGFVHNWRHFFTNTSNPMNGGADFDQTMTNLGSNLSTGHSFASMLLGVPSTIRRGQGNTLTDSRTNNLAAYVQDDWRVSPKLTVNVGLRYEFTQPPYEVTDRLGNLLINRDPKTGVYTGELMWAGVNPEISPYTGKTNEGPRTLGFGRALQRSNYKDFAPRLGIAYQLDRKTVIRTAYGMFFNSTFVQELQDKRKFWPYTIQQLISSNTGVTPDLLITDAGPPFSNTSAIGGWPQDPYKRSPYSQQWNFTIQRQVMSDMTVDIGYVGSSNKRQIGYTSINQAVTPGPGDQGPRRLLAASGLYGNMDGGINQFNGSYHSFRANLDKRFGHGLTYMANYTWGKALTNQSSLAEQIAEDEFNRRLDWGRASIDLRHIFQSAWIYDLPFGKGRRFGGNWGKAGNLLLGGWSMEGILRLQTGAPINVVIGQDQANVGNTRQRPNLLRDPNVGHSRNVDVAWFDTTAYAMPTIYTFGNAPPYSAEADGRQTLDLSFQKDFRIRERHNVQFRAEYYNLPNHVNMGNPNATFTSSAFGKVTTATSARQIQFALRYAF